MGLVFWWVGVFAGLWFFRWFLCSVGFGVCVVKKQSDLFDIRKLF